MESSKRTLLLLAHDYSWGKKESNIKKEGVAELKFWNFNVPYKAYMALTNVKTLQLWKFCNTLANDM